MKVLIHVQLFMTPWTITCKTPPSMGFSRQEYWSGLSFPSLGDWTRVSHMAGRLYHLSHQKSTKWKSFSPVWLFMIPWTIQSMKFSRPEYWSSWPFPSPEDLSNPGIECRSLPLQADSLPAQPVGKPRNTGVVSLFFLQCIFPTQELNWDLLHCRQIISWATREALVYIVHKNVYVYFIFVYIIFNFLWNSHHFPPYILLDQEKLSGDIALIILLLELSILIFKI